MKRLYILAIGLMLSNNIQSQNYVPLVIDSLYNWSWGVGFHNDTIIGEYWSGFSYDSNDSLIQRRVPSSRFNYSYEMDTIYLLAEQLDANNTWNFFSRSATAYDNGKIISKLTERYENNGFENSALYTYYYDGSGLDTLVLLQHWNDGAWSDFYKKEKTFDANGNNTEEAEYYVDSNGDFDYNRGKLFDYDDENHLIEEIRISSSINGEYLTGRTNWAYGNDDLLDTIVTNGFYGDDDEWIYYGKELTFAGPEIYSSKPDSVIFYRYWEDSLTHTPTVRQYLQYQDLGNDMIYFKDEKYDYFPASNEWKLTRLTGQNLTIKEELANKENLEILIFDMQGRLVSRNNLTNQSSIQAPIHKGIYSILIREKSRLIGVTKLVIIE